MNNRNRRVKRIDQRCEIHKINQKLDILLSSPISTCGMTDDIASCYLAELTEDPQYTIEEVIKGINSANSQYTSQMYALQTMLSELPQNITSAPQFMLIVK